MPLEKNTIHTLDAMFNVLRSGTKRIRSTQLRYYEWCAQKHKNHANSGVFGVIIDSQNNTHSFQDNENGPKSQITSIEWHTEWTFQFVLLQKTAQKASSSFCNISRYQLEVSILECQPRAEFIFFRLLLCWLWNRFFLLLQTKLLWKQHTYKEVWSFRGAQVTSTEDQLTCDNYFPVLHRPKSFHRKGSCRINIRPLFNCLFNSIHRFMGGKPRKLVT